MFRRLCVQGVFVHQLKLWTLHGILRDPFDEFFVRVKASAATAHSGVCGCQRDPRTEVFMLISHDWDLL